MASTRADCDARVAVVAERRVGRERLQERQVAAQPVERADRGLGVRHADVDVHPGDGRGRGVAEQIADAPVARLRGDLRLAAPVARLQAAADGGGAGRTIAGAQLPQRAHRPATVPTTGVAISTSHACSSDAVSPGRPSGRRSRTSSPVSAGRPSRGSTRSSSSSTPSENGFAVAEVVV